MCCRLYMLKISETSFVIEHYIYCLYSVSVNYHILFYVCFTQHVNFIGMLQLLQLYKTQHLGIQTASTGRLCQMACSVDAKVSRDYQIFAESITAYLSASCGIKLGHKQCLESIMKCSYQLHNAILPPVHCSRDVFSTMSRLWIERICQENSLSVLCKVWWNGFYGVSGIVFQQISWAKPH